MLVASESERPKRGDEMPDSPMFIVRKPQLVVENDAIFDRAKAEAAKLPCPVHAGGHEPRAMRQEIATQNFTAWGWSFSIMQHGDCTDYAYFCVHCHVLFFVELAS